MTLKPVKVGLSSYVFPSVTKHAEREIKNHEFLSTLDNHIWHYTSNSTILPVPYRMLWEANNMYCHFGLILVTFCKLFLNHRKLTNTSIVHKVHYNRSCTWPCITEVCLYTESSQFMSLACKSKANYKYISNWKKKAMTLKTVQVNLSER